MLKKLLFLFLPALLSGQATMTKYYQMDTSFTLNNAYTKVVKDFPFAKQVDRTVPSNVTAKYDLIYSYIGKRFMYFDLFTPKQKSKKGYPLVVIIHGGGWRSGDKSMEHHIAINLAAHGYAAATIEYTLSTKALYPTAVYDIDEAITWIIKYSHTYNVNPKKIVVMGASSGAHLATLVGTCEGNKDYPVLENSITHNIHISAIINIDGVLDLTTPDESAKDSDTAKPSAVKQWLGATYKDNPKLWVEASPLTYINSKTPPILFINSSLPRFHAGRDEAITILNKYKIYSEVHTIPDTPHPFWLFHPWFDETFSYILKFLDKAVK